MMSSTADRTGWMVATEPNDVLGEALLRRGGPRDSAGYRLFKRENPQGLWTSMSARQRAAWIERADDETTVNDQPATA